MKLKDNKIVKVSVVSLCRLFGVSRQAFYQWEEQDMYLSFLPTYSPHLNPIELVWKSLKYRWLKKVDYQSWACL